MSAVAGPEELLNFDWRAVSVLGCSTVSALTQDGKDEGSDVSRGEPIVQLKLDLESKSAMSATSSSEGLLSAPVPSLIDGSLAYPSRSLVVELNAKALDDTIRALQQALSKRSSDAS